ncbi:unnamed protein product [Rotaria sordida]|uniref:PIPK domain-containing protein n=1 Tax=Rotaria sordida TaxID=392033 RepID=A0A813WPW7_9BILA|nr:unnamed protein product [Rotaria sordida]
MASNSNQINTDAISEGLHSKDIWKPFNCHLPSYLKSSIQLPFLNSKISIIGRVLRHAIVDLLYNITKHPNEYIENETTIIGTEHRLYHSRRYRLKLQSNKFQLSKLHDDDDNGDDAIEFEISSIAPTVFYKLREDIGISNIDFRRSFSKHHLQEIKNPGKSGAFMYKTFDDLYILKTLHGYEARLLMEILSGYHLQLVQRPTLFNRYVGLYSVRFRRVVSSTFYIAIAANAFTSSLKINQIFDLKGSTIKRKSQRNLCPDKLHHLKDVDFMDLYPNGIRIPSNIYHRLHTVISNDIKVLKKLNIVDFSVLLGIRHLDGSNNDLIQPQPSTGVAALFNTIHSLALLCAQTHDCHSSSSSPRMDLTSLSNSLLKPLQMIGENIDTNLFYNNDSIACATLPIPGIINHTNQRVYLYLCIVDMLQQFDCRKCLEQKFKKITDPNRYQQYSTIEPDEYEKRIFKFLFENVFIDAGDNFLWARTDVNKPITDNNNNNNNELPMKNNGYIKKTHTRRRRHSIQHHENSTSNSDNVVDF